MNKSRFPLTCTTGEASSGVGISSFAGAKSSVSDQTDDTFINGITLSNLRCLLVYRNFYARLLSLFQKEHCGPYFDSGPVICLRRELDRLQTELVNIEAQFGNNELSEVKLKNAQNQYKATIISDDIEVKLGNKLSESDILLDELTEIKVNEANCLYAMLEEYLRGNESEMKSLRNVLDEKNSLLEKLEVSDKEIKFLHVLEIKGKEGEIHDLRNLLRLEKKKSKKMQAQMDELNSNYKLAEKNLLEMTGNYYPLNDSLDEENSLIDENAKLKEAHKISLAEIKNLKCDVEMKSSLLEKLANEGKKISKKHFSVINAKHEKINELHKLLNKESTYTGKIETQMENISTEQNRLHYEVETLKDVLDEKNSTIQVLEVSLHKYSEQSCLDKSQLEFKCKAITRLQDDLNECQRTYQKKINALKSRLEEKGESLRMKSVQFSRLQDLLNEPELSNEDKKSEAIVCLQNALVECQRAYQKKLDVLRNRLEEKGESLTFKSLQYSRLQEFINESELSHEAEVKELMFQLNEQNSSSEKLFNEVVYLQDSLEECKLKYKARENDLNNELNEKNALMKEFEISCEQVYSFQEALGESEVRNEKKDEAIVCLQKALVECRRAYQKKLKYLSNRLEEKAVEFSHLQDASNEAKLRYETKLNKLKDKLNVKNSSLDEMIEEIVSLQDSVKEAKLKHGTELDKNLQVLFRELVNLQEVLIETEKMCPAEIKELKCKLDENNLVFGKPKLVSKQSKQSSQLTDITNVELAKAKKKITKLEAKLNEIGESKVIIDNLDLLLKNAESDINENEMMKKKVKSLDCSLKSKEKKLKMVEKKYHNQKKMFDSLENDLIFLSDKFDEKKDEEIVLSLTLRKVFDYCDSKLEEIQEKYVKYSRIIEEKANNQELKLVSLENKLQLAISRVKTFQAHYDDTILKLEDKALRSEETIEILHHKLACTEERLINAKYIATSALLKVTELTNSVIIERSNIIKGTSPQSRKASKMLTGEITELEKKKSQLEVLLRKKQVDQVALCAV